MLRALRPYDETVRLVNSTRLSPDEGGPGAPGGDARCRAGIDAVNLHHTDWTGGLTTLFHRFERVCFGWDLQFEHVCARRCGWASTASSATTST